MIRIKYHTIITILCLFVCSFVNAQSTNSNIAELKSPNSKIACYLTYEKDNLIGILNLNAINHNVIKVNLGIKTNKGRFGTSSDEFQDKKESIYNGTIESKIGEKSTIKDQYKQYILTFKTSNNYLYDIIIRLYDEGFAVKYDVKDGLILKEEYTSIDLTNFNPTCYSEKGCEHGYTEKKAGSSGYSLAPLFIQTEKFSVLMNEAGNLALADRLKIEFNNGIYSFSQSFKSSINSTTSWRYCVFGETPSQMIEGKYIIYSLNEKTTDNTDWIKPGKVFRACIEGNIFYTDSVKERIDFAKKMNFSYVLLDAGWYGLGYSNEHNKKSDPLKPIPQLNIQECCNYAQSQGIGIILYVNKVAWTNYDNEEMLNLYQSWGVKGLKLGFMDGESQYGLKQIYDIIKGAYDRKMLINVHDDIRPTGLEMKFPNLMTTEGIRGNEHRDNLGNHTTLLPFSRYMTGSADYTICYKGYPEKNVAYKGMNTTKGHQLALSTAFFCPIQHLLWYGKPKEYPNETEIEYFKELPTVWDDYKILEGDPGNYFSIARKKDDKWFVSTHNYGQRTANLSLDFLSSNKTYSAVLYEDDGNKSIKKTIIDNLTSKDNLSFKLFSNGGATAIITVTGNLPQQEEPSQEDEPTQQGVPSQEDEPSQDDEPSQQEEPTTTDNDNLETSVIETPDNSTSKTIKIYPNPADNYININIQSNKFIIMNITGKKMMELNNTDKNKEIDISHLKPGIYIITNGISSAKFIKK
ncbi:MAG: glycoside hydrolase family 97 catalytic domain-containing protein [Bacteroidales bacterium]|nr:glycoside hydrolase family 97 catalytic domain-containing protein [Bacteroidales bacterium]